MRPVKGWLLYSSTLIPALADRGITDIIGSEYEYLIGPWINFPKILPCFQDTIVYVCSVQGFGEGLAIIPFMGLLESIAIAKAFGKSRSWPVYYFEPDLITSTGLFYIVETFVITTERLI